MSPEYSIFVLDIFTWTLQGIVLVVQWCPTLWDPGTVAQHIPLSMGFTMKEYWSRLPFPSLGHCKSPLNSLCL